MVLIAFLASCEKQKTERPFGSLIEVPNEVSTIQEALNTAQANDTILLHPDEYNEWDLFPDKSVFITSLYYLEKDTNIINQTVINADNNSRVFFIHNISDTIKLNGFTIANGLAHAETNYYGGGIYCYNSKLLLTNINIDRNFAFLPNARGTGGGIYVDGSYISLDRVNIRYCVALYSSGAIHCINSSLNCNCSKIENNSTRRYGPSIHFDNSNLRIKNSTIGNNHYSVETRPDYTDINVWHCSGFFENVTVYNDSINFSESTIELINCNLPGY